MASEYALVGPSDEIKVIASNVDPTVETKAGWNWRPVERTTDVLGAGQVYNAPVTTVLVNKVTVVTTARNRTVQEISDARDSVVNRFDSMEDLLRAAALVIMDELNRHTTYEAAQAAAVAAASSLANLQTRWAALTPVPQRTGADIRAAIRARLGS